MQHLVIAHAVLAVKRLQWGVLPRGSAGAAANGQDTGTNLTMHFFSDNACAFVCRQLTSALCARIKYMMYRTFGLLAVVLVSCDVMAGEGV